MDLMIPTGTSARKYLAYGLELQPDRGIFLRNTLVRRNNWHHRGVFG